jgi:RimJ/RimL family protein N-acetyltransferase
MTLKNWPLSKLRVRSARVELVYPDDAMLDALADLGASGIHDPSTMPFLFPWSDVPAPQQQRNSLQFHWRQRAELRPESWGIELAVLVDGSLVGVQGMHANDFAILRSVDTGSWLARPFQGKGIGTEMRAAVLHLAFAGLGAVEATSGAFDDNPASLAVSAKLGYEHIGERRVARRGEPARLVGLRLTRARWEARRRDDITIDGLDPCLSLLGAGS